MRRNSAASKAVKAIGAVSSISAMYLLPTTGLALDNIIRPYQSARSSGMGGVKLTTGLYDENFFGNPARTSANPRFRFTFLDPMFEVNGQALKTASTLAQGGDVI